MADIDELPNITSNFSTQETYTHQETNYDKIFLELFTFVGILVILTNSVLVFTILRFEKLKKEVTNLILVHLNIVQAVYLLATPLTLRVNLAFRFISSSVHISVFCSFYQAEAILGCAVLIFLMLLIFDGYLKLYHKKPYDTFTKLHKFIICAIYFVVICACTVSTGMCAHGYMTFVSIYIFLFIIASFFLFLIIMNVIHFVKKQSLANFNKFFNLGLSIGNIFFMFWTPWIFFIIISIIFRIHAPLSMIFLSTFGFSSPIFNLFYLYKYYNHFHIFLRQVFKCQCNNYQNETLIEDPVSYNDNNGVTMSVN